MTSVSAGHIILTPTTSRERAGGHRGDRSQDLLTRRRALYRLSDARPDRLGYGTRTQDKLRLLALEYETKTNAISADPSMGQTITFNIIKQFELA